MYGLGHIGLVPLLITGAAAMGWGLMPCQNYCCYFNNSSNMTFCHNATITIPIAGNPLQLHLGISAILIAIMIIPTIIAKYIRYQRSFKFK